MRIAFLTSTPLSVAEGSGTFTGIYRLARALRRLGPDIEIVAPERRFPVHTLERLWFNETLDARRLAGFDAVVGFDMDGFRLPKVAGRLHVASIKGVVGDEARFERGPTRWTMSMQALCEGIHVRRADVVITTSMYAAGRITELYRCPSAVRIVPEMIDLPKWQAGIRAADAPASGRFTVLTVCRLFPRKRLDVLLEAAAILKPRIPGIEFRIVGDGPQRGALRRRWKELRLGETVTWLGSQPPAAAAGEYARADVFCLPSVQEGFGIVYLEAMAAGKPVVAAMASAAPEVASHALLAAPGDAAATAASIESLYRDPALAALIAYAGLERVKEYDSPAVARRFLDEIERAFAVRPKARAMPA